MQSLRHVRRDSRSFILKQKNVIKRIHRLRESLTDLDEEMLRKHTEVLWKKVQEGRSLDAALPEAFALVYEGVYRIFGFEPHDEQLLAAIALHNGCIAEQATGEGKTITACFASFLHGLTGEGVHVVTVNDYLAKRDAEEIGAVHRLLGLTCGCVLNQMDPLVRKESYQCDVTYITNSELGFDYLRDNMAMHADARVQRPLSYAIVDEADSIFIDEARTPLIISGQAESPMDLYKLCDLAVRKLERGESRELTKLDVIYGEHPEETGDYIADEKDQTVRLTEAGVKKVERFFGLSNFSDPEHLDLQHYMQMALKAHALYHRDQEYVVLDGEVQIVDTFTGRVLPGRRYSDGLHQAIEAKEGVEIKNESRTLATITYQSFFTKYPLLAGMTGTASTEAQEFYDIYGLRTIVIPTHKPVIREDLDDEVYLTKEAKYTAIANQVFDCHFRTGQPVLLGTPNVEVSETLSRYLTKLRIPHEVLNAKQHEREAEIIAKAGVEGTVTIATNMAGRGTDIKLTEESRKAGGLFVIGSERHEARRIDQQLRGRSGRQGDPGKSKFYLSLEDDVMRLFAPDRMMTLFRNMGVDESVPITHPSLTRTIRKAQMKIEGNNFGIRKHLVDYEDVNNAQRELIYKQRNQIIEDVNLHGIVTGMLDELSFWFFELWNTDVDQFHQELQKVFGRDYRGINPSANVKFQLCTLFRTWYAEKVSEFDHETFEGLVQKVLLSTIDRYWMRHLDNLEVLKQDVALIGYGQRDPVITYRISAYERFDDMLHQIRYESVRLLFKAVSVTLDDGSSESKQVVISKDKESTSSKKRQSVLDGEPEGGIKAKKDVGSGLIRVSL